MKLYTAAARIFALEDTECLDIFHYPLTHLENPPPIPNVPTSSHRQTQLYLLQDGQGHSLHRKCYNQVELVKVVEKARSDVTVTRMGRKEGEEELVMVTKSRRDQRYVLPEEANKLQEMSYMEGETHNPRTRLLYGKN